MNITIPMYQKGRSFIMAGGLLKAYEGHHFVYLHLFCQGFECIGKALLLSYDYDKYEPILREDFGHNLEKLLNELKTIHSCNFLSQQASEELLILNSFYKQQQLRYGDKIDFNVQIKTIKANNLHSELVEKLDFLNDIFKVM